MAQLVKSGPKSYTSQNFKMFMRSKERIAKAKQKQCQKHCFLLYLHPRQGCIYLGLHRCKSQVSEYRVLPLGPWKLRRRRWGSVLQGKLGYTTASSPRSDVGCAAHHLETLQDFSGSRLCPVSQLVYHSRRGITLAEERASAPGAQHPPSKGRYAFF